MRTVDPRLVAGSMAGAMLLALTACGGAPEPQPLPKPTSSTSPTPSASASASPTPPVMPEAAGAKTKAGAEASVRFFLAAMEYAGDTGDVEPLDNAYTKECTRCKAIAEGIKTTYRDGGSIVGGAWLPIRLKFYGIENDVAYVDAVVDYEPQTWIKSANGPRTTSSGQRSVLKVFQLIWRDGRWRVGALDPQA